MIRSMPTTAPRQLRYDHRLRRLVQRTGDVTVGTDLRPPPLDGAWRAGRGADGRGLSGWCGPHGAGAPTEGPEAAPTHPEAQSAAPTRADPVTNVADVRTRQQRYRAVRRQSGRGALRHRPGRAVRCRHGEHERPGRRIDPYGRPAPTAGLHRTAFQTKDVLRSRIPRIETWSLSTSIESPAKTQSAADK